MDGHKRKLTVDRRSGNATEPASGPQGHGRRQRNIWPRVNWVPALSTVLGAAMVILSALGAGMSADSCSDRQCPNLARGGIDFGDAFYAAPAVVIFVIGVSFFTARRPGGIVVPMCGWALLVADVAVMTATVAS